MNACLGIWVLVADLSHYSSGDPPESGMYQISAAEGEIRFTVDWVKGGTPFSITFAAPDDGSDARSTFPGIDRFWLQQGPGWLATFAGFEGRVVATAMRRVSADGSLMSVLQENADGQGGIVRMFQVYRRT